MRVKFSNEARRTVDGLPRVIQGRMWHVIDRLKLWPSVSGAKPLRGALAANFRIRTGDYRLVFRLEMDEDGEYVLIWRIGDRKDVYLD